MKLGWLQTRGSLAASNEAHQDMTNKPKLGDLAEQHKLNGELNGLNAKETHDSKVGNPGRVDGIDRDYIEARVQLGIREAMAYTEQRFAAEWQKLRGGDRDAAEKRVQLAIAQAIAYSDNRISGIVSDIRDLRQHIPGFLNAVATVPALAYQVSSVVASYHATSARVRDLEQHLSQIDTMFSTLKTLEPESDSTSSADLAIVRRQLEDNLSKLGDSLDTRVLALMKETNIASKDRANLWKATESATRTLDEIWSRIEFIRKELTYELRYGPSKTRTGYSSRLPRIVDEAKLEGARRSDDLRLNLGCGRSSLPGYINVDFRDLPGVDVVAEVSNLPFEDNSIREIISFHILTYFTREQLRRLLIYWRGLLQSAGVFRAVVPDGETMIRGLAAGNYPFEEFRTVLFGTQEYEGDFHLNLLTPESLSKSLADAGFINILIPSRSGDNNTSFDFEITATVP